MASTPPTVELFHISHCSGGPRNIPGIRNMNTLPSLPFCLKESFFEERDVSKNLLILTDASISKGGRLGSGPGRHGFRLQHSEVEELKHTSSKSF